MCGRDFSHKEQEKQENAAKKGVWKMAKRATMISGLFCVAIAAIDGDWFAAVGFTLAMLWAREYFILKESEG